LPGSNGFRDTPSTSGDDQISGNYINTGTDGVCNTTADDIDDPSGDPYNPTASDLQTYLNSTIYNQAVVNWSVTKVPATDWNWDLDRDDELDVAPVPGPPAWSNEELAIINNCDPGGYNKILFIVSNPDQSYAGKCQRNERYGFVYYNQSDELRVAAHELGHQAGDFGDLKQPQSNDTDNLMWYSDAYGGERLRNGQWVTMQGKK